MLKFPRAVWLLGFVSLATDAATEAIYPILPFFLTQVLGASAVSLGVIEGAAEAVNSGLKVLSGRAADRAPSKRPLVLLGYSISSIARPLMAIAQSWTNVFAIRLTDRVGKGIRGAPRDAMLAGLATPETRGKVFGFHRGMDHTGAVLGPLLATLFLYARPGEYRTLFALTIIPGAISVALLFFVREGGGRTQPAQMSPTVRASPTVQASGAVPTTAVAGATLPPVFKHFMIVLGLFTLGNATDAFLLLRLTDAAGGAKYIPLMWAALHIVKATSSIAFGGWSDRIGRRKVIAMGWLVYAVVYGGFAVSASLPALLAWFMIYGLHFGLAEGAEKAFVADLAPETRRGLAFGWYTAVQGLGALAASLLFGIVWSTIGAPAAFAMGAALALTATLLLFLVVRPGHDARAV